MKLINILTVTSGFLFLLSCSHESSSEQQTSEETLSIALDHKPRKLISSEIADYYSSVILNQTAEGLVRMSTKNLSIQPQLAEKWNISSDKKTYTFTLRKNVLFHAHSIFKSDEERQLTTGDVIASVEYACTKKKSMVGSVAYNLIYKDNLKGAREFFEGNAKSISGLKAKGQTIEFELLQEDEHFLSKLTHVSAFINSKRAIEKQEFEVGTGPFIYEGYSADSSSLTLVRNEDYYEKSKTGEALPMLSELHFIFNKNKSEQLEAFERGETDVIIGLPPNKITEMLEGRIKDFNSIPPKFLMRDNPMLISNYYFFNMHDDRFKNVKVRQAFNLAIDKEKLGIDVLKNQYFDLGYYGITPPLKKVLKGYDFDLIKKHGYSFNPELAKKLLAEAGYPNGEGFGSITLRISQQEVQELVAEEFAKQIAMNLNINVNIDASSFEIKEEDANFGRGDIFGSTWAGDFLSPETFLMNFYSKDVPNDIAKPSFMNQSRYNNPKFDSYFNKAKASSKLGDAMSNYCLAERELMIDPPLIPLWYSGEIQITYSNIRNLNFNPLGYFLFKEVYKKPLTKEEYNSKLKHS